MIEDYNRLPFKKIHAIFQIFFFLGLGFRLRAGELLGLNLKTLGVGVFFSHFGVFGVFLLVQVVGYTKNSPVRRRNRGCLAL